MKKLKFTRNNALLLLLTIYFIISFSLYKTLIEFPPSKILGDSYRLFFLHIPTPIVGFFSFTIALMASILYIKTKNLAWDDVAASSVKIGFVFSGLALATGWAFSYEAWNSTWSWDPKALTMMILFVIYLGYFALRQATYDPGQRAKVSAIYGIMAYLSIPLTYMSSRLWFSLHPEGSIGLTSDMKMVAVLMVFGFVLLNSYLLWFEVTYKKLAKKYENMIQEIDI